MPEGTKFEFWNPTTPPPPGNWHTKTFRNQIWCQRAPNLMSGILRCCCHAAAGTVLWHLGNVLLQLGTSLWLEYQNLSVAGSTEDERLPLEQAIPNLSFIFDIHMHNMFKNDVEITKPIGWDFVVSFMGPPARNKDTHSKNNKVPPDGFFTRFFSFL